jgi:phosphoserine phosphatase
VQAWLHADGRSLADFDAVRFYSDSANDLPLLDAVSEPVVVNADERLSAIARERGWPQLQWRRTPSGDGWPEQPA